MQYEFLKYLRRCFVSIAVDVFCFYSSRCYASYAVDVLSSILHPILSTIFLYHNAWSHVTPRERLPHDDEGVLLVVSPP